MKKTHVTGLIIVFFVGLFCISFAQPKASGVFYVGKNDEGTEGGVYISSYPENTVKKLYDSRAKSPVFSPDGKKIAFFGDDSLYVINNDGTGLRGLESNDVLNYNNGGMGWTTSGFIYLSHMDDNVHLYKPLEKKHMIIARQADLGQKCDYWGHSLFHSADGKRLWLSGSLDPYNIDSLYCGCRGYARGGHPYIQFSDDYTDYDVIWRSEWGHGRAMSASGYLMLVKLGEHRRLGITKQFGNELIKLGKSDFPSGAYMEDEYYDYDPPYPDPQMEGRLVCICINNDSIMGSRAYILQSNAPNVVNTYFWNWRTHELFGEFKRPGGCNECGRLQMVWYGDLPDPHNNQPYFVLDKSNLIFIAKDKDGTMQQQITAKNISGDVDFSGTLTAEVEPAQPGWLSVSVSGEGNTQKISTLITLEKLPSESDVISATVSLKAGSASSLFPYKVIVYKGSAIPAPSALAVSESGDSLLDAKLVWKDNAPDETGYIIERKTPEGEWSEIGRAKADCEEYIDLHLPCNSRFYYRVQAYKEMGAGIEQKSGFSNEEVIEINGIVWIRITNPVANQTVKKAGTHWITWRTNKVDQIKIDVSNNGGLSWNTVTAKGGILKGTPNWGNYPWSVPDEDTVFVRVAAYSQPYTSTAGPIVISSELRGRALPAGYITQLLQLEIADDIPFLPQEYSAEVESRYTGSDYCIPTIASSFGIADTSLTWRYRTTNDSTRKGIGFWTRRKRQYDEFVAYWFITIVSKQKRSVKLAYDYDELFAAWHNGSQIINAPKSKPEVKFSNSFSLKKGDNHFLFRLSDGGSKNYFRVKFVNNEQKDIADLYYQLGFGDSVYATDEHNGLNGKSLWSGSTIFVQPGKIVIRGLHGDYAVKLYSLGGRLIGEKTGIREKKVTIPLSRCGAGMYIVHLDDGNKLAHKKIVIRR